MPYKSISELPDQVRSALPVSAQEIYMNAFNAAYKKFDGDEGRSHSYAWGAVKRIFEKDEKTGEWKKIRGETSIDKKAKDFFNFSDEEWEAFSPMERQSFIDQLPWENFTRDGQEIIQYGTPKTDEERAVEHFFDGDWDKWNALTDEEKEDYLKKLPPTGTKRAAQPRTEEERAKAHFEISDEEWEKLTEEEKAEYIKKLPPRGTAVAIRHEVQCSEAPLKWARIGDSLKINGTIIAEGTWTGLDMQTVYYPRSVFPDAYESIVGGAIKRGHKANEDAVIGFVTAARCLEDKIEIEGIIFDKNTIDEVILGDLSGISMEADVKAKYDESKGVNVAQKLNLLKATLVENPACDPCRVGTVCTVSLKGQEKKKEKKTMSIETEYMLLYAKPSKDDFYDGLEKKLKAKGLEDDIVSKVVSVLKSAIKVPYPYPYPAPTKGAKPEEEEEEEEEEKKKMEYDPAMLRKPSRASFLRWLEAQLQDEEEEERKKVMKVLKKRITTPFLGEDVKLSMDYEQVVKDKDSKITELSELLKDIAQGEVNALLEQIKETDKTFDEKELLEGVEDLGTQKKLLSSYLKVVAKAAEPQISVNTTEGLEAKVGDFLKEMGVKDIKDIIEG